MKKQRVLALLLALSLALGTNGMSVLAAGPDLPGGSVTVEDNGSPAGEEASEVQTPAGEAGPDDDMNDGQAEDDETDQPDDSAGEDRNGSEQPGDQTGDDQNDLEQPGDQAGDDQNDPEQPGDQTGEDQTDPEQPGDQAGDDQKDPENPDASEEEQNPDDEVTDDISANDVPADEEEDTEKPEEEEDPAAHQSLAPRMMTFQDETGMRITYDANVQYDYIIDENGTLTGITKAGGGKVEGNVVLDETKGIKRIASGAFAGNTEITYIKMPAGLTAVGADAFKGCTALRGMTIPTGVTVIEESAFEGCNALTQFALPATIESIGNRAFYGDSRLFMVYMKSISISRLQSIGDYAFYGCSVLEEFCSDMEFTFPESLTSIGGHAFEECRAVKSIAFSKNISTMGAYVFASCSELREITLPQSLTGIPQYGFADCSSLVTVEIPAVNKTKTVGAYAFKGCYNLGSINLRLVNLIEQGAFADCTGLIRVQITEPSCQIEENAFPVVKKLYLIGVEGGTVEEYALLHNDYITFISMDDEGTQQYYQCVVQKPFGGTGNETIELSTVLPKAGGTIKDPNKENGGQGVKAGTLIYVRPTWKTNESELVSIKYNGIEIQSKDYVWSFVMPKGGARITAEFKSKLGSSTIVGTELTVEFSNGADGTDRAELKVGQPTRMFLLDREHHVIPMSKAEVSTDKPTIVKVDKKTGVITALKEGLAHIDIKVTSDSGQIIPKRVTIHVSRTDAASLKLTVNDPDERFITISEEVIGGKTVQTASMDSKIVSQNERVIKLEAVAYDADLEEMAVALKWSTSDSKVARLASTSTANAVKTNTVTIPAHASGEATITITATNADKKTVSQKLIIQVTDQTPRLSATSLTLNPNKEDGVVLRVISAYGGKIINPDSIELVDAENDRLSMGDFVCARDQSHSTDTVHYYTIRPYRADTIEEKVYKVKVKIGDSVIPTILKITVKSSLPNPKVAFDKKQPKINLFYANDGTQVKPVITNLGNERVSRYELEPLNNDSKKDDWLFTENFAIDPETGVITQKNEQMTLTQKGKLITTGYLVLHFEGYKDNAVKKYKITIPTQTVKPSYKLDRTSDTYNSAPAARTITLTLMDTKTKKPVVWDESEGEWTVTKSSKSNDLNAVSGNIELTGEGQIVMQVNGNRPLKKCKVVLSLRNDLWAEGKSFEYTYNINASTADPKIKLKASTVNLNSNYAEQTEKFYLTSNQCDTILSDTQEFMPSPTRSNGDQFEYIHVDYTEGVGTVSVDSDIKSGSYQFRCDHAEGISGELYNAVTLTVKVVNTTPTMSVKGTPALNLSATADGDYTETAELALNAKMPEGYEIDGMAMIDTIECTTKGMSEVKENFDWDVADNKLLISLNSPVSQKSYAFTMKPVYTNGSNSVEGKNVKFSVKVYRGEISVKMSAKGVLNLVDRESREYTLKNSIVYTPSFKNLKDTIEEVQIFDAGDNDPYPELGNEESRYFYAEVLDGKVYVAPREDVELENKKTYPIMMWVRLANFGGYDGMWVDGRLNVKTAQVLPKVTADRKDLNLYLSNKNYEATFRITPKEGSVGKIVDVVFGEKDTKAQDSFEINCDERADGSIDVHVKLKGTVSFAGGSTNQLKMYAVFKGQGTNTTGPAVTMNVKINK